MFTDDPIADFMRHDAEQERLLSRLPVCAECGEPIQDEQCIVINDMAFHRDCILDNYTVYTDSLMD